VRLSIEHRTTYRFSQPQARLVQMLRMTPTDTDDQTVADWRIDVCCDARLKPARDGFGNIVTMLYAEGPIAKIEIAVAGEVLTRDASGVVRGAAEPFPPVLYARTTPLTEADAAIAAFAAAQPGEGLARLHALNQGVRERFALGCGRPEAGLSAADAFTRTELTARDLAHVFIAAARSISVPARYVSGYSLALAGGCDEPAPHGWAEAWVDGLGWVGFDPATGLSPAADYVRIAIGLDSAGAAPVAGSRLGDGDEELDVDMTVERLVEG